MKRFAITIFIIIMGLLLMTACGISNLNADNVCTNSNLNVDTALSALLNCNNYKSEWFHETKLLYEGELKDHDYDYSIMIIHNPYSSKISSSFDPNQDNGIISCDSYEFKEGDKYKYKEIYKLEGGNTKEFEIDRPFSREWFITQIKSCLLSEEFVENQIIDGINVKKYKITVTAYPFALEFGLPLEKNNAATRIFMKEFKESEGYVYINSETGYIQKIEFDLSEKMALNKEIRERVNTESSILFITMPDYEKYKISIVISNINDDSNDIADIEEEIERVMGR